MIHLGNRSLCLRKTAMIVVDMIMIALSLWGALLIHFDGEIPTQFSRAALTYLGPYLLSGAAIYFLLGFYDQIWRFASIRQYGAIYIGTMLHTQLMAGLMTFLGDRLPWSVYLIYWMISLLAVISVRISYRIMQNRLTLPEILSREVGHLHDQDPSPAADGKPLSRVLIVGAGNAGNQIIRDLLTQHTRLPVAVIDDDPQTHSFRMLDVPVVGDRFAIPAAVQKYQVDMIILAIPSASRQAIREIVEIASKTDCELKIIPHLHELIDGAVSIADIKDVDIEDLLGREEVQLDTASIAEYIRHQVVLVTGGGGSIGSELCRQIALYQPRQLIVFDVYENNAYQLQYELKAQYGEDLDLKILIGSVRDSVRLDKIFAEYKPQVIFHAAAHKHVPLMEDSPGEAVKNNIFGTYNVAEMAIKHHVKHFVLISTDKAVNPTNVMGATKRVAEMIVQTLAKGQHHTRFAAVRFGNVLGSNGSVIPLFKQQIRNDRKVTITHPDITRYFMTIPEAARLVIQAGAFAEKGDIFVLDMGEPVKIVDLAQDLIRLSGFEPGTDVQIEFTGLRPGEKMYEELMLDKENLDTTRHQQIFRLRPIQDREALEQELAELRQIIRWEHPEFSNTLAWLIGHYQAKVTSA